MIDFALRSTAAPTAPDRRAALIADPGFGKVFTDHMLSLRWRPDAGWHAGEIIARGPIALDPAAAVLHYAQEIFEGLKAYRLDDGAIATFRPSANAARFVASAARLAMPALPVATFVAACDALIRVEAEWVPDGDVGSLYLRPFMFADEAFLGVRPAQSYRFIAIASPAGGYFRAGAETIAVRVADGFTRAAGGGTGAAKCGGNYAASLLPQEAAVAAGCDQALFLDARDGRFVEELSGMNLFAVRADGTIVTPPLDGTILPGITRDAIMTLARDAGHDVREERIAIDAILDGAATGAVTEFFACGTAAVVAPIRRIVRGEASFTIGDGNASYPVAAKLREALVGIQRGQHPDPYAWVHRVA